MIYAEDLNYWKSGKSSPDTWIEKTTKLIERFGGEVLEEYAGTDRTSGKSAYKLVFRLEGETFNLVWPVLPSKTGDMLSAKRQATTMIYHRVKSNLLDVKIFGARVAFFQFLVLPDGRTASQVSNNDLLQMLPDGMSQPLLVEGEIVK